jgi:hypothetical protein
LRQSGAATKENKAYVIGGDGHIASWIDPICGNEADARKRAEQLLDGQPIELWGWPLTAAWHSIDAGLDQENGGDTSELAMSKVAELLEWKQTLLERMVEQSDPERLAEIQLRLKEINDALNQLESEELDARIAPH